MAFEIHIDSNSTYVHDVDDVNDVNDVNNIENIDKAGLLIARPSPPISLPI